jgi:hypothetical protein
MTITLTGTFVDAQGNPVSGRATFTPVLAGPTSIGNLVGEPIPAAIVNGALSVPLVATDEYVGVRGQVSYRVYLKTGSVRQTYYIVLPSTLGTTANLDALLKYAVPPDVVVDPGGGTSSDPEVAQLQALVEAMQDVIDAQQTQLDSLAGSIGGFNASITAINATLGASPQGSEATVAARLSTIEAVHLADTNVTNGAVDTLETRMTTAEGKIGNARLFSGTSYPPAGFSAVNGDVFVDTTGL